MMEEEKNNVENSAEPTGDQAADAQSSAVVPLQPDKPLSGKELRRQKKEAAAAQKAEAAAQKAREKAEAEAQKARQKEESLAAKLQRRQEKRIPAGRPPGTRTGNKTALAYRGIRHACDVYCACD